MMAKITEKIVTIKSKGAELEKEIREKTLGYIITSFGLVAGLAWNDAIKAFIDRFFSDPGSGLKAKFLYAALLTVVMVAVSLYLSRIFKVEKKKKDVETIVTTTKETSEKTPKEKK
jgi:TRAP-type C4-dicarboxylate transport system permease small subunit